MNYEMTYNTYDVPLLKELHFKHTDENGEVKYISVNREYNAYYFDKTEDAKEVSEKEFAIHLTVCQHLNYKNVSSR